MIKLEIKKYLSKQKNKFKLKKLRKKYKKDCLLFGDNIKISNELLILKNAYIYDNVHIWGNGNIELGEKVGIGFNSTICATKDAGISIGDNTLIAANCYIIDMDHGVNFNNEGKRTKDVSEPIKIGKDVWIGANCVIAKGSVIGDGATIGACSFVNGEIPPYSIAAGTPAKVIKYCNRNNER